MKHAPTATIAERLWARVPERGVGCWLWVGALSKDGYGKFNVKGRIVYAHRAAYELSVGPIPEGKEIDHLCRNRACVNPAHLEAVTRRENQLRGNTVGARNALKTHCVHGHPYDERNTYLRPDGKGRQCRLCIADRRARRRVKAA